MDELEQFCADLNQKLQGFYGHMNIDLARVIVRQINDFLYATYPNIGTTSALGNSYQYLSEFHKYWERNHRQILDCQINPQKCELVADELHHIYLLTQGNAFYSLYDTHGLEPDQVCRVRLLSANQDFNGSRNFSELAQIYSDDSSIFDIDNIIADPETFVKDLNITNLSQTDKRISYAHNIATFLKERNCEPYNLIDYYKRDIFALRTDLINRKGAGYGNKKTDMFLRDMVVLGVWDINSIFNFDKIDVASDVNTIKVALRTGIIETQIPLVTSFLDIFCHQYVYIDQMNAQAWRTVWNIWNCKYPNECIPSPCLLDYFVYGVVGKQFCKENLYTYQCDKDVTHIFKWHSPRNKTCQICRKVHCKSTAHLTSHRMCCTDIDGAIAISNTDFVKRLPNNQKISQCPFHNICGNNRYLQPPKSISILGQTGWTTAYTVKGLGGGGLMA